MCVPVFLLLAVCLVLFVNAATWKGRTFGAGAGLLCSDLLLLLGWILRRRLVTRRGRVLWAVAFLIGGALLAPSTVLAPPGAGGDAGLRVEHVFMRPGGAFPRYTCANIVPEWDQAMAGLRLWRILDPRVDGARGRRHGELFCSVYGGMAADPAFRNMGSVMDFAYSEWIGFPCDRGHYVSIVPRSPGKERESILFLHASGGNLASYWYVLSPLAREHDIALVFPSFGYGNWQRKGGVEAALAAADDACRRYSLDANRMLLVVLSSGGRAATRVVARYPHRFRGVVFISAVLEDDQIDQGIGKGAWRGLPVLFINGEADEGVPVQHTEECAARMEASGARVTRLYFPRGDHFIVFSERRAITAAIARWVMTLEAPAVRADPIVQPKNSSKNYSAFSAGVRSWF